MDKILIYCDGGSRSNPGHAASAFLAYQTSGDFEGKLREIFKKGEYLGILTNNVAEYKAVIMALDWLVSRPESDFSNVDRIDFFLDSNLVVNQINGKFKVKDQKLETLLETVKKMLANPPLQTSIAFHHIYREKNAQADKLVNETLDKFLQTSKMV